MSLDIAMNAWGWALFNRARSSMVSTSMCTPGSSTSMGWAA